MNAFALTFTKTDVGRLLGLVSDAQVTSLIRGLGAAGTWLPYRGQPDDFGPSLYRRVRERVPLTTKQINAARALLLQRNWESVKALVAADVVVVSREMTDLCRGTSVPVASYRSRRSSERREAAPVPAPQPVAQPAQVAATVLAESVSAQTGMTAEERRAASSNVRLAPTGSSAEALREQYREQDEARAQGYASARDRAVALRKQAAADYAQRQVSSAEEERLRQWGLGGTDPGVERFRLVLSEVDATVPVGAAFVPTVVTDLGVERFSRLDLD